jgi:hypothetical protein
VTEKKTPKRENTYEQIVVAAREARRLNAIRVRRGIGAGDAKVTSEALDRMLRGEVEWQVAEASETCESGEDEAAGSFDGTKKEDPSFGD